MSTKHTANIYVTNNSGGNANIQMTHQYSSTAPDTGSWNAAPGQTVGPLVAHFETGFGTGFDYWWLVMAVKDGPNSGIYTSGGSIIAPNKKECMLESADANQNITNTVDTNTFNINLVSGGCSTGMTKVAPYSPIKNVFVLMLENNSFDRLLGFSGIPGLNGLTGNESNSYNGTTYTTNNPIMDPLTTDPGHEFQNTLQQLTGQTSYTPNSYPAINNSGFVLDYATNSANEGTGTPTAPHFGDVISCQGASAKVPVLTWLAQNYAVCDNWFSSMPGPTWPNRLFAMGGSSAGLDDSPTKTEMAQWFSVSGFTYENGSIFDLLASNKMQYRLYNDDSNMFAKNPTSMPGGGIPIVAALKNIHTWDVNDIKNFPSDLEQNYPYQFTWIEPNYGNIVNNSYSGGSSQHPMDSLAAGDAMVSYVYNAIRNSSLWPTSMLIITYDEHGGFYDHAVPPPAIKPGDTETSGLNTQGFTFDQYGVRVPAVIVSPLIPAGTVDHTLYDHTSILKTVETLFHLPSLTQRDANANALVHLLTSDLRTNIAAAPDALAPTDSARPAAASADPGAPLPEQGNVIGFLHAAAKADAEISGGDEAAQHEAAVRLASIRTNEQAEEYLTEVKARIDAVKAAKA